MKKGYHTWPSDSKPHPVGKKHKKKKEYADETINNIMKMFKDI
jgi:hypothetical protein